MTTWQSIIVDLLFNLDAVKPGKVHLWRETPMHESEAEAINVRDISNEINDEDENLRTLMIEVDYETHGDNAVIAVRDTVQTILDGIRQIEFKNGITGARLISVDIDQEKAERIYVKATITIAIIYYSERWQL
jgi:hypothetical protein